MSATSTVSSGALYHDYRPQRFSQVIGQEEAVTSLRNSLASGRVHHSIMLHGIRGTGKTTLARIIAASLNCTNRDGVEPCGTCESCTMIRNKTSFNVLHVDAASNNGVDYMRDLQKKLAYATSGFLVIILDEAHMLSRAAWNALLNTVEEPPGGKKCKIVFVICTTEPENVLDTIRSRCLKLPMQRVPEDVLVRHLTWVAQDAGKDVPAEVIAKSARMGQGSVRDALSALEAMILSGGREVVDHSVGVVDAIVDGSRIGVLVALRAAMDAGAEPRTLAEQVYAHLVALFVTAMGAPDVADVPDLDGRRDDRVRLMGSRRIMGAMDEVGDSLAAMRSGFDARVHLQVHLCRYAARVERATANANLPNGAGQTGIRLAG